MYVQTARPHRADTRNPLILVASSAAVMCVMRLRITCSAIGFGELLRGQLNASFAHVRLTVSGSSHHVAFLSLGPFSFSLARIVKARTRS